MVDWLVFTQLALTRVEAMTLASALLEEGFLRPIGLKSAEALRTAGLGEQLLDDSTALYSFVSAAGYAGSAGRRLEQQLTCVKLQADSLKKRGSVKAETSLSAVEMSGQVIKRGYLLKQVRGQQDSSRATLGPTAERATVTGARCILKLAASRKRMLRSKILRNSC